MGYIPMADAIPKERKTDPILHFSELKRKGEGCKTDRKKTL